MTKTTASTTIRPYAAARADRRARRCEPEARDTLRSATALVFKVAPESLHLQQREAQQDDKQDDREGIGIADALIHKG